MPPGRSGAEARFAEAATLNGGRGGAPPASGSGAARADQSLDRRLHWHRAPQGKPRRGATQARA